MAKERSGKVVSARPEGGILGTGRERGERWVNFPRLEPLSGRPDPRLSGGTKGLGRPLPAKVTPECGRKGALSGGNPEIGQQRAFLGSLHVSPMARPSLPISVVRSGWGVVVRFVPPDNSLQAGRTGEGGHSPTVREIRRAVQTLDLIDAKKGMADGPLRVPFLPRSTRCSNALLIVLAK